jgi:hypothetical protein
MQAGMAPMPALSRRTGFVYLVGGVVRVHRTGSRADSFSSDGRLAW